MKKHAWYWSCKLKRRKAERIKRLEGKKNTPKLISGLKMTTLLCSSLRTETLPRKHRWTATWRNRWKNGRLGISDLKKSIVERTFKCWRKQARLWSANMTRTCQKISVRKSCLRRHGSNKSQSRSKKTRLMTSFWGLLLKWKALQKWDESLINHLFMLIFKVCSL